jgi:hypothetical protein
METMTDYRARMAGRQTQMDTDVAALPKMSKKEAAEWLATNGCCTHPDKDFLVRQSLRMFNKKELLEQIVRRQRNIANGR